MGPRVAVFGVLCLWSRVSSSNGRCEVMLMADADPTTNARCCLATCVLPLRDPAALSCAPRPLTNRLHMHFHHAPTKQKHETSSPSLWWQWCLWWPWRGWRGWEEGRWGTSAASPTVKTAAAAESGRTAIRAVSIAAKRTGAAAIITCAGLCAHRRLARRGETTRWPQAATVLG